MALVRAKRDVYLGEHGYRTAGEEFEYTGSANHHLETVEKSAVSSEADVESVPKQVKGKGSK